MRNASVTQSIEPPRLRTIPQDMAFEEAFDRLHTVAAIWSLLSEYGRTRFMTEGWRALGLGLVHVADPAFETLAGASSAAWATLDARDGWNQTILDIARRQRAWFDPAAVQVLEALDAATPTLFEVEAHRAPRVNLRRVCDGKGFELHARLDHGAYPPGALLVARVVHFEGLNVSLCSSVVARADAAALVRDGRIASNALVGLMIHDAVCAIDQARAEKTESNWVTLGPAPMRRVSRAAEAFQIAFSRRSASIFRHAEPNGRLLYAELGGRGCRLTIETTGTARRLRAAWIPEEAASAIDRALAFQAGLDTSRLGILRLEVLEGGVPGPDECKEVARACVSAAGALEVVGVERAA